MIRKDIDPMIGSNQVHAILDPIRENVLPILSLIESKVGECNFEVNEVLIEKNEAIILHIGATTSFHLAEVSSQYMKSEMGLTISPSIPPY